MGREQKQMEALIAIAVTMELVVHARQRLKHLARNRCVLLQVGKPRQGVK
jgi:hypothetical protein